jgi:hypothetical protein
MRALAWGVVSERNIKCVKIGCGHKYSLTCGSILCDFVYDEPSRTPFEMRACVRKKPGRGRNLKIMQNFIDSQESRTNNLNCDVPKGTVPGAPGFESGTGGRGALGGKVAVV